MQQTVAAQIVLSMLASSFQLLTAAQEIEHPVKTPTFYRTTKIDGLTIFYREAGPKDAPTPRTGVNVNLT